VSSERVGLLLDWSRMMVEEEDDGMDDNHLEVVVHCDTGSCDRVACDEGRSGFFPIVIRRRMLSRITAPVVLWYSVEHQEDKDGSTDT
jgi:hypothetical protein